MCRIGETITNHSGYDFPWTLWSIFPFQGSAYAHDAHHSVDQNSNFGSFFCWMDRIFGTEVTEEAAQTLLRPKHVPHDLASASTGQGRGQGTGTGQGQGTGTGSAAATTESRKMR